jgi:hypothetical protein
MNKDAKIYGGIIVVVAGLYLASSSLDIAGLDDLFMVAVALGGIGFAAKLVQDKKITNRLQNYGKSSSSGTNYSTNECMEIANEWAKEAFHGKIKSKKGVSFDWTQSSTEPAEVYKFGQDEWLDIRYFYTPHGPKNKAVIIFVDATNGEHYATESVIPDKMKDNPFNYLESYKQTKRMRGRIPHNGDENNQNIAALTGIPVNQGFQPANPEDET